MTAAEQIEPSSMIQTQDNEGLLTLPGTNTCIGYLYEFEGVQFSPDGAVNCTAEQAKKHNEILDQMLVKGLDDNCQVGKGYHFYYNHEKKTVHTWLGKLVSADVTVNGRYLTFCRGWKTYQGKVPKKDDMGSCAFNFTRIS